MSQTGPWSKFSTDQRARDAAREAAFAEGVSLGEYLSRLLSMLDEPQPSETSYSYNRRTGSAPPPAPDSALALDRLTRRIEATEARSTLAITGIDHTVHGLVARLQNSEQTSASIAGHVEGLIDEMRVTHEALQAKVRRLEKDDSPQRNIEALKALEGALGKLATHVYDEGELTQNETAAIKGRVESGFSDLSERVEGMETRVDRTLSDAAARVERAVQQAELRAEGTARGIAERMSTLETRIEARLRHAHPATERLNAVEADVSGALNSMESTLVRIQERLNRAETGTDSALKSLELTFAHLDERIEAVASQIDPEQAERLKREFEQRFEDLTRSVRSAVDNARLEIATEITKAAANQDEKIDARLKAELGDVKSRLAEVETREAGDLSASVHEKIGRLGATVAERIDALAAQVDERLEESELRSAEAIEQVGEQVTVAAVRLQKRQDEALTALAQEIDGTRKASDARLSDALASVSERFEKMQTQSSTSLSPVQRAISALATRLESLESFTTPPHVAVPPPVLPPGFAATPPPVEPAPVFTSGLQAKAGSQEEVFEAGFSGWEVSDEAIPDSPYKADFDAIRAAGDRIAAPRAEPARPEHNYIADVPGDDREVMPAPAFDPVAELDGLDLIDDSLEHSHSEARESDIFDDEPDYETARAQMEPRAPASAATDELTSDYLARARAAAMAATEPNVRPKTKGAAAPATARTKTATAAKSGASKLPMVLAASAVVMTGAGVGGYLYLRGKQPVAPALAGPVDTYVDPATGIAAATTMAEAQPAAPRPAAIDAEQILFEDETALIASTLFDEAAPDAAPPIAAIAQAAAEAAAPAKIASLQPVKPVSASPDAGAPAATGSAPSIKPAAPALKPQAVSEPAKRPVNADTSFPPIPAVVTVEAEANAGNGVAQYQFAKVKLVEGEAETATSFLRRAAQKGVAPAQYDLGKLYERGQGVDKDMIEARSLIQKAAEAGHVTAMYDLALFMAEGEGGPKSESEAVTWFEQAAAHGLVDAQYNLGVVHAEGIGTDKNLAEALFWFEVAAEAGDTGAAQEVTNLRTRMTMADSMSARERAAAWKATDQNALANGRFGAQRWNTGNPLQVQAVQTALGRLGLDAGTPDGVLGPQTAEAIRDYQRAEKLDVTGTITPALVDHLNAQAGGTRSS